MLSFIRILALAALLAVPASSMSALVGPLSGPTRMPAACKDVSWMVWKERFQQCRFGEPCDVGGPGTGCSCLVVCTDTAMGPCWYEQAICVLV